MLIDISLLRFTEIASKVEAALSQEQQLNSAQTPPAQSSSTRNEPSFLLVGSTVLWRELTRIWSPNMYVIVLPSSSSKSYCFYSFLYGLTRQFVKLTLQLLSRYSSWVYASYANSSHLAPSSPSPASVGDSLKNSATINLAENVDEPAVAIWSKLAPSAHAYLYHDLIALVSNVFILLFTFVHYFNFFVAAR